jgi:hypothetical protein
LIVSKVLFFSSSPSWAISEYNKNRTDMMEFEIVMLSTKIWKNTSLCWTISLVALSVTEITFIPFYLA